MLHEIPWFLQFRPNLNFIVYKKILFLRIFNIFINVTYDEPGKNLKVFLRSQKNCIRINRKFQIYK